MEVWAFTAVATGTSDDFFSDRCHALLQVSHIVHVLLVGVCAVVALPYLLWSRLFQTNSNEATHFDEEYRVLCTFYNATGGEGWLRADNWLDATKPLHTWHGVKVCVH